MDIKGSLFFLLPGDLSKLVGDPDGDVLVQTVRNDIVSGRLALYTGSNSFGSLDFHFFSDYFDPVLGNGSEDSRKDQRVVDLILEVTATTTVNPST